MPTRLIADEHGETMKLLDVDGYLVSPIPFVNLEEELKSNGSWKAKEDDVIVCAYPKSVDFGSWFDYTLDWENTIEQQKDHPIHVIHYEDMKENSSAEIKRLAKFIGVDENLELFKSIEDICQFDKMKKGKETIELKSHWVNSESGMYRKGIIGDWKNLFTVAQNEEFDRIYEEKMKKSRLIFKNLH